MENNDKWGQNYGFLFSGHKNVIAARYEYHYLFDRCSEFDAMYVRENKK